MSINILDLVVKKSGYPPLLKVDPNTGEIQPNSNSQENKFSQAAIPAILIGLYRFTLTDEGAEKVLKEQKNNGWVQTIFGNTKMEAAGHIADYAGMDYQVALEKMNEIASTAIGIVKENISKDASIADVKKFMADQRNHILPYLPAALHMGETVNDPSIDDNTNKMEGPVSNLMKAIGGFFSDPVMDKEIHHKDW